MAVRVGMRLDPDPAQTGQTEPPFFGRVLVREVQPGLFVNAFDVTYVTDMALSETVEPGLMCGVRLFGGSEPLMVEGHGAVWFEPGRAVLLGLGVDGRCDTHARAGCRCSYAGVSMKAEFFERPLGTRDDLGLRRLARLLDRRVSVKSYPCSPTLAEAAARLLNNPYQGILADLYLESCALAQVAEISRLVDERRGHPRPPPLSQRQRDRVHRAREILDQRIVDPPSMEDLSRQVGINATSLRAEFQRAYGTSVFGYVREQRLQLARALLMTEDLPVSAIGYRAGFGNPCSFATAYRRRFGHSPSQEQSTYQSRH